jgi:hypothetical protein
MAPLTCITADDLRRDGGKQCLRPHHLQNVSGFSSCDAAKNPMGKLFAQVGVFRVLHDANVRLSGRGFPGFSSIWKTCRSVLPAKNVRAKAR